MKKTKVFKIGNSKVVRLPRDFAIDNKELYINRIGSCIVLMPESDPWDVFEKGARSFSKDFLSEGSSTLKLENWAL